MPNLLRDISTHTCTDPCIPCIHVSNAGQPVMCGSHVQARSLYRTLIFTRQYETKHNNKKRSTMTKKKVIVKAWGSDALHEIKGNYQDENRVLDKQLGKVPRVCSG